MRKRSQVLSNAKYAGALVVGAFGGLATGGTLAFLIWQLL